MLQREVQFNGDEACENCGEPLDTNEGDTVWRESPSIILLCNDCDGTYRANTERDVLIISQS